MCPLPTRNLSISTTPSLSSNVDRRTPDCTESDILFLPPWVGMVALAIPAQFIYDFGLDFPYRVRYYRGMKNPRIYKGTKWGKTNCHKCGKSTTLQTLRWGPLVEMFQQFGSTGEKTARGKFEIRLCPLCFRTWNPSPGDECSLQVGKYIFTHVVQISS